MSTYELMNIYTEEVHEVSDYGDIKQLSDEAEYKIKEFPLGIGRDELDEALGLNRRSFKKDDIYDFIDLINTIKLHEQGTPPELVAEIIGYTLGNNADLGDAVTLAQRIPSDYIWYGINGNIQLSSGDKEETIVLNLLEEEIYLPDEIIATYKAHGEGVLNLLGIYHQFNMSTDWDICDNFAWREI